MSFALAHESNKNKGGRDDRMSTLQNLSSYNHANTNLASRHNGSTIHLQRTVGNQEIHRLVGSSAGFDFANIAINSDNNKNNVLQDKPSICTRDGGYPRCSNEKMVENNRRGGDPIIQPKLKVSQPNDPYEQEADRVADNVMRVQISSGTSSKIAAQNGQGINQKGITCEKNMHEEENEKPSIRRKSSPHISSYQASDAATSKINAAQSSSGGGGSPLDVHTKEFMESGFGFDFSKVRIHSDKRAEVSTRSVGALAYTKGNDVFFGKGKYEPSTWQGKRLLAHELTHVIQQTNVSKLGYRPNIRPDLNISNPKEVTIARKPAKPDIRIEEEGEYVTVSVNDYPVVEVWNLIPSNIHHKLEELEEGWDMRISIPDVGDATASAEQHNIDLLSGQGVFVYVQNPPDFNIAAPHLGSRPELNEAELEAERASREINNLMRKIQEKRSASLDPDDEQALKDIVARFPLHVKRLEKEVVLWPKRIQMATLRRIIEILTKVTRKSEIEESQRSLFHEKQGEAIKQEMSESAKKEYAVGQCLAFIYDSVVFKLYADEEEKVRTAKSAYKEGLEERIETLGRNVYHTETLSRLASELRLQGLLGPINLLKWVDNKNTYEPHPADLFDSLSGAGDGWYFFLVSMASHHSFVITVHVSGGSNRKYFKIEAGRANIKTRKGLKDYFDYNAAYGVDSRVWQVYFRPTG